MVSGWLIREFEILRDWSTVLASVRMTIWLFVEWGWFVRIFAGSSIDFLSALVLSERLPIALAFSRRSPLGHSMRMPAPPFFVAFSDEPSV